MALGGERIDIALAVPIRNGLILVTLRGSDQSMAGKWEFPGGKVVPGEDPIDAARRELREETGLEAQNLEPLTLVVHDYREIPLRLHVFLALDPTGEVVTEHGKTWDWLDFEALSRRTMPEANRQILRALRWRR